MWNPCLGEACAPAFLGDFPCFGDPWCAPGKCKALCFFFSSVVEFGLGLRSGQGSDLGLDSGCYVATTKPTDLSPSLSSPRRPRAASARPGASRWVARDDLLRAPECVAASTVLAPCLLLPPPYLVARRVKWYAGEVNAAVVLMVIVWLG